MNTMVADRAMGHMREEILADKGMGVIVVSSLLLMAVTAVKEEKLVNIKAVEVLYFSANGMVEGMWGVALEQVEANKLNKNLLSYSVTSFDYFSNWKRKFVSIVNIFLYLLQLVIKQLLKYLLNIFF